MCRGTQQSIRPFSGKDADAFPAFRTAIDRTASVLASAFEYAPPVDRQTRRRATSGTC